MPSHFLKCFHNLQESFGVWMVFSEQEAWNSSVEVSLFSWFLYNLAQFLPWTIHTTFLWAFHRALIFFEWLELDIEPRIEWIHDFFSWSTSTVCSIHLAERESAIVDNQSVVDNLAYHSHLSVPDLIFCFVFCPILSAILSYASLLVLWLILGFFS